MPHAALVSYRLGGPDGVSVEAAKWLWALGRLGYTTTTVAGEGDADHVLPGLAMDAPTGPSERELARAMAGADVVVVENVCSLPLNAAAARTVAALLVGRPTVMHHHDLPWDRPQFRPSAAVPDDPAWRHVTINAHNARLLERHSIAAAVVPNHFDTAEEPGDRDGTRARLGVGSGDRVVLQPTRAIPRKNVPTGLALAESLGAHYWLLGPAEEGYGPALAALLTRARVPVHRGPAVPGTERSRRAVVDAYAACDIVVFPSTWEGFGNPPFEAAVHRRAAAVGAYPVASEHARVGFRWFNPEASAPIERWLQRPDGDLLDHNETIVRTHFALADLPQRLEPLLPAPGRRRRR